MAEPVTDEDQLIAELLEGAPEAPNPDGELTADDLLIDADGGDEDGDPEGDGEPTAEPQAELPPAPTSWGKDDAAAWEAMTPEAREVVGRRERERDAQLTKTSQEAANTRRELQNQTMEAVAKNADDFAAQLQAIASAYAPAPPDQRLLYTGNPDDVLHYQRQFAAHSAGQAQQQELQQRVAQSQRLAYEARSRIGSDNAAADAERLKASLPEFFDPEQGRTLRQTLESVGTELGYTPELMAQADATDILGLHKAMKWREDANKWRQSQQKRMAAVRSAKKLPGMTRPGAVPGQAVSAAANVERESAAYARFNRDGDGTAALAILGIRKT